MNGPELLSLLDKAHRYGECIGQLEVIEAMVSLFEKGGSRKRAMEMMAKLSSDNYSKIVLLRFELDKIKESMA